MAGKVAERAESIQPAHDETIADRFRVHEVLGRGGMGCVYRVTDTLSGRQLALKQLMQGGAPELRAEVSALFEREFHTLAQLRHPSVIEVYDYGVNPDVGPFYTMELLDGGDLRDRSPLPWREACAVFFDVCSSLALLHSRRLLHRDVSPRNIRCTRSGTAKLIDFGAMAPMGRGGGGHVVGTPAFTPPEILQRSALDSRTDLFSVGAALYYALTRSLAYPARSFADLLETWRCSPPPPSARVAGIPPALDDLVMSLLSLEPVLRPHSSFEVMQRLAAIGGFECREEIGVSRGYLATPVLVGRDSALHQLRDLLARAASGQGGGLLIEAESGFGRSRMLDACALEAKTLGATVLRAAATGGRDDEDFAVARGLLQHAQEALCGEVRHDHFPELFLPQATVDEADGDLDTQVRLRGLRDPSADVEGAQGALGRLLLALGRERPLVIVVDDVQRIDMRSAAFLAELIDRAADSRVLVALSAETGPNAPSSGALQVLASRCLRVGLPPLDRGETQALLGSVFGDVANLHHVAEEIAAIAHGNPREILVLAQHLVDHQSIRYAGGSWTLPSRLSQADLPASAEAAICARIDGLPWRARFLAEAHALAFHGALTREDYQALCADASSAEVDDAISELLQRQALASEGRSYTLANRLWRAALIAPLGPEEARERHAALSLLYEGADSGAAIHHMFLAGYTQRGLDAMVARVSDLAASFDFRRALSMDVTRLAPTYLRAIDLAAELERPPRELHELRRWLVSMSVVIDVRYYESVAADWLAQIEHDAGLDLLRSDTQPGTPLERLSRALRAAGERYLATPEAQRVYRVDEAIRALAHYVAISAAIGARTMDNALIEPLAELIEPFAPLSPVLNAIWQNVSAAREAAGFGRYERARARWTEVHGQLASVSGAELQHIEVIRNAIAFAVGVCESVIGRPAAEAWAERLDHDPMQRVNALYLRKIVRFEQGDFDAADRLRRQAEVSALEAGSTQMFTTLLAVELASHAQARDLAGLKEVMGRLEPFTARYPGWAPFRHLAEGRFELIRGDLDAAARAFERCIEATQPDARGRSRLPSAWLGAQTGWVEAQLVSGRVADAHARARAVLAHCDAQGIEVQSFELTGLYAVAAVNAADGPAAMARLDAVIARQQELGVSGLKLGLSHEMRARAALHAGDVPAFQHHAALTAREYRHGAGSPLGVRYERLMNEARRAGYEAPSQPVDLDATTILETSQLGTLPGPERTAIFAERAHEPTDA